MAKRYFNWTLAFVLVVAIVVFAAAAFALHSWQRSTRAEQALPLGEQAYDQGDWTEAAKQLGRYLAVDGSDVRILLKYADAQLKIRPLTSDNIQQAIAAYSSALRQDSGNTEAARRLVEIYLGMGTPGEAELKAQQYLKDKDDPVVRRFLGVALVQQREFQKANDVLGQLVQDHPDQILAYEVMGRLAQARPEDVNEPGTYWFDEAIKQNPDSALAYTVRAAFRWQRGNRAGTMADLEHAETLDLSDTEVHLRLIGEWINTEAFDKARAHLTSLRQTAPTERMLWQYWAQVAIRSGAAEEMRTVAEAGLKELATQPWDFMPVAAELLIRTGQNVEAKDCVLRMKEKNVQPARVAFLEGLLAEQQGQLREAIACWETAIGLGYQSPQDNLWGRKLPFVRVVLASAFLKMGDTQSGIGQLRTLVSQMPTNAGGHLLLARLESQTGDWAAVLEHAGQVKQLVPGHREATLLELQARIRQLADAGAMTTDRQTRWQDIDGRLTQMESSETDDAAVVQIKLLQAESAMLQKKYDLAGAMLDELQQGHPQERRVALLRAQVYVAEGKDQEATSLLRGAVEQFPQSVEVVTRLALLYNGQAKRSECESVVRDAVARMEQPRAQRVLGLFLADFYASWGQDDPLYQWLTGMAQQFPDDIQTKRRLLVLDRVVQDTEQAQGIVDEIKVLEGEKGWQWRIEQARVWIRSEDFSARYTEAVRLLQENLLANPEDKTSRMLLGAAYEKAGEGRLAVTTYREALARSRAPDDLQIMLVLAAAYERTDDLPAALAMYREMLERAPNDIQIIARAVEALYKAEEFDEARQVLDRAAQQDLQRTDLQRLRLQGDLQRGALESASDILQEMVSRDPNDNAAKFTLAMLRARQKRFDEAQTILTDLRAENPDSARVTEAQIQLYISQGKADEAIQLCDELVERLANASAFALRARTYAMLGLHDKALADLDRTIDAEPERPGVWLVRANFYRDLGRTRDEIADVKKALSLAPDNLMIQQRALPLFLASGDRALFREAEVVLERAIEGHPESAELKVLKARVLLSKGTGPAAQQARLLLGEITTNNPDQAAAWELLGRLEMREEQPGSAMDVALRGLAHNADDRQLLLLKADAEAQRSPMLAVPTLRELLRQDPNDLEVLARLAEADLRSDRPERTRELLELLQERLTVLEGPQRRSCETILAMTLYRSGQTEKAVARFEGLMQAEPNDPTPLLTWARLPAALQRCPQLHEMITGWVAEHPSDVQTPTAMAAAWAATRDEQGTRVGEELVRSALQHNPESVGALLVLADLTGGAGRAEETADVNRRILEIDPNNVIAINNLAWFLCEERGQHQQALELANRGLEMVPEYLDLIDTRGVAHYRMGHFEDAVRDFTRFVELSPVSARSLATTRVHLARTYAEMGRKTEAVQQLEQVLNVRNQTGGLSPDDLAAAKVLLEQLKKGS